MFGSTYCTFNHGVNKLVTLVSLLSGCQLCMDPESFTQQSYFKSTKYEGFESGTETGITSNLRINDNSSDLIKKDIRRNYRVIVIMG